MIEVNNRARSNVPEAFLRKVVTIVLKGERARKKNVSIALVGPKTAEKLNKEYRNKDNVANVLSFKGAGDELGEVILCPRQIKKEAQGYGMIFEKALAWMLIHGLLHLMGYDHEQERDAKRMERKEAKYLTAAT